MRAAGGSSVVVLVPSIALAGAAGYAMLATVAEGLRVLAKGCGRQWAQHGITANTVATAPHHWVSDEAGQQLAKAISLSVPAFRGTGDAADDLAPLVAALASPDAHFLTAGTLVADGGVWMGL
jgi:NAD(P)-dependent dehydrogenase (short-subunit alcohol dehydrogenase family)